MIQDLVYTPFVAQRMTKFQQTILESVGCSLSSEVKKKKTNKKKTLHKGTNYYYSLTAFIYKVFIFTQDYPEELVQTRGKKKTNSKNISL